MEQRRSKIMVPIDIPAIADHLDVDPDSVFGRLYYHLDPKYAEPAFQDKPRRALFTPVLGDEQNCVNFPLLEAVLAGLWEERNRNLSGRSGYRFSRSASPWSRSLISLLT
jgi:hypothetical protein